VDRCVYNFITFTR